MAIDYNQYLTDEQRRSILEQRLQQFASESYQHDMNKIVAEKNNDTSLVQRSEEALVTLQEAITVHAEELAKLPEPVEQTVEPAVGPMV